MSTITLVGGTGPTGCTGTFGQTGPTGITGCTGTFSGVVYQNLIPYTDSTITLGDATHNFAGLYVNSVNLTLSNVVLNAPATYSFPINANTSITSTWDATSTGSGALQVYGGVGVKSNVVIGGNVVILSTTESSSTTTGALVVSGGVGISANLYVEGNTYVLGAIESTSTNTGTLQIVGGVGMKSNLFVGGNVSVGSSVRSPGYTDIVVGVAWGTTTFNFITGTNYWMNSGTPAATTASVNFSNLTATSGYSYTFTIVLPTTNPAFYYSGSTFQVNGGACTFKSNISSLPTPTNFILQSFTCMYLGTTWYVITSAVSF